MLQTEAAGSPPLDQRLETLRRRWFWMSGAFAAVVLVSAGMAFVSLTVAAWTFVIGASGVFMSSAVIVHDLFAEDSNKAKRIWDRDFRYRQTLALMPEGVVILGEDFRIEWINARATDHLGVREDDVGRIFFDVVKDDALQHWIHSRRFAQRFFLTRRNPERQLEVAAVAPDIRHMLIVTHDVTARRRIDDMRKDFVANVSHELRTPLTVISGFLEADALSCGDENSVAARHRQLMIEQTRRMRRLLEDLLTLSKLENGEELGAEEAVVIAMPKLVEDVVKEGRALSMGRHEIVVDVEDVSLIGQPDEIRSAAMNLVSNAVRYTPAGGRITVSWKRVGVGASLSVTDTGIGIDPKHIPRLTERFFRVDKGRSRETGGTGLGLAIVKHVLRRNGGELEVNSTLGKGSTFSMHVPESRVFAPFL